MKRLRSIVPVILVLITTLLVGCGQPMAKVPPTYTPEKLATIEQALLPVNVARERMSELKDYIDNEDWTNVDSFIHGPLGGLRGSLGYIDRTLLPKDQDNAEALSKELFLDLERIDVAAAQEVKRLAKDEYARAIKDFDRYLNLLPTKSAS